VKAAQLGRPIVMSRPNSKVSIEIRDIARALAGIRNRAKTKKGGGSGPLTGFLNRLRKSA
jgi:MinD-like ATPase involved in chromosome partitioning or flagellar assembly